MSGIAGVFHLEGSFDSSERQAIASDEVSILLEALAHRGSDGSGLWCRGAVGLGHRLLWTTSESRLESLPQESADQTLVITADARIDNRNELRQLLKLPNKANHEITDSDFILAAYEKWGEGCAEKLLGDFAFVIWDHSQQKLFCARDHFGVKPFYYFKTDHIFVFASEVKGLLAHPNVPGAVDESQILNYLTLYFEDKSTTAYKNIYRLPPAHTLSLSTTEGLSVCQYWALSLEHEIRLDSDADYEAEFYRIFSEAVRCRLRSAFPIGAHLSGGLDSSSIVCVARSLLQASDRPPLHTFSNIYPDVPGSDEQSYIAHVVNQGSLSPHYVRADRSGPLTDQDQLFEHVDEPLIGNGYLMLGLNKAASAENVRVLLNGYDGDTTVSHGILRLQELVDQDDWKTFVSEVKSLKKNLDPSAQPSIRSHTLLGIKRWARKRSWIPFCCACWSLSDNLNIPFTELLYRYGVRSVTASWKKRLKELRKSLIRLSQQNNKSHKAAPAASVATSLVQTKFSEQVGLSKKAPKKHSTKVQSVRERQWKSFTYGITVAIEVVDLLSAPYDVEPRYPFMDKRLVEFCVALPAEQKLKNGWTRSILRRAMQDTLPTAIQWRNGKTTPAAAFKYGLEHYDKALIDSILADEEKVLEQYVDTKVLRQSYEAFLEDTLGSNITSGHVWAALSLSLWLRGKRSAQQLMD